MRAIRSTVFSFEPHELPQLDPVWSQLPALATVPASFDLERFLRTIEADPACARERNSLDIPPNEDVQLHAEYVSSRHKGHRRVAGLASNEKPYVQSKGTISFGARHERLEQLATAVSAVFRTTCPIQGDFLYPPLGFRGWHTNAYDRPGWRMYLVSAAVPGCSSFRIWDEETSRIVDIYDPGVSVNFFRIHPRHLLWHGVVSFGAPRWSQGFAVPSDWARRLEIQ